MISDFWFLISLTNRLRYRGSSRNLNSTARPYDQQAFSPPDPTAIWHLHLALAIYIFVVVNFDALAQASDFRIERRYIHTCIHTYLLLLISMLWHMQAIYESKGDKLSSSAEGRIRTQRVSDTYSPADGMPADKPTELSRIKLKTWTRQAVPMISKHSAHLTPLSFGICTWLWRYTYLLLLISMLWHRQAIFQSKGDTYIHTYIHTYIFVVVNFDALAQASDIRIQRRQVVFLCWRQDSNPEGLRHLFASRLNACWQTDWAIEDQAKNLNSTARPYDQQAYSPPDPAAIWFAPGSGDIHICCC